MCSFLLMTASIENLFPIFFLTLHAKLDVCEVNTMRKLGICRSYVVGLPVHNLGSSLISYVVQVPRACLATIASNEATLLGCLPFSLFSMAVPLNHFNCLTFPSLFFVFSLAIVVHVLKIYLNTFLFFHLPFCTVSKPLWVGLQ